MFEMRNRMRSEAARVDAQRAEPRQGIISGYDPVHYAVKVQIMPESAFPEVVSGTGETGWLPLGSCWTGSGWGDYSPPSIGDQVTVVHQEGATGAGIVHQRIWDQKHLPLAVPSGERWIVHKNGSLVKFLNNGHVSVNGEIELDLTVGLTGETSSTSIIVTADAIVLAFGGVPVATLTSSGVVFTVPVMAPNFTETTTNVDLMLHTHSGVQTGGGLTGIPVSGT